MTTYDEYRRKMDAKRCEKTRYEEIKNKKPISASEFLDQAAKSTEIANNAEKAGKIIDKLVEERDKCRNDTILTGKKAMRKTVERTKMSDAARHAYECNYATVEHPYPIPNPNDAFRRRKGRVQFFSNDAAIDNPDKQEWKWKGVKDLTAPLATKKIQVNKNFTVPARYKKVYDEMIARGNSIEYTIVYIKNLIANETSNVPEDGTVPAHKVPKKTETEGYLEVVKNKKGGLLPWEEPYPKNKPPVKVRPWDHTKNDWSEPVTVKEAVQHTDINDPLSEDDNLWDIDDTEFGKLINEYKEGKLSEDGTGGKYKMHTYVDPTKKKQDASNKLDDDDGDVEIYGNEGEGNTPEDEH